MKKNTLKMLCLISLLVLEVWPGFMRVCLAEEGDTRKTISPYFLVEGDDSGTDRLPLKKTHADIQLNGVIANVKITQVYRNQGSKALNAKYIFPGSTHAAVNGMTMTIGKRKLVAKIKEKLLANQIFEKAKKEGKSASLLSQKRPNVFSMDVANVMPGDEVVIDLSYTEIITAEKGIYQFVYPSVVGPRYGGDAQLTTQETAWIANPYLKEGVSDGVEYGIDVAIHSPIPLQQLESSSHSIDVKWQNKKAADIHLSGSAESIGNRDFILSYRLQGDNIVSGLTHFSHNGENYFLLLAEPPKKVIPDQIPAREYLFVVDVSGSMDGFPLQVTSDLIESLLKGLKPSDRFNILFFAGGDEVLADQPLAANEENIARGITMMRNQNGNGGTELYPALQRALKMPHADNVSRSIVVVTDGYIGAEDAMFKLIAENLHGTNLFTFGIGSSVNRFLIEGLAKVGQAEAFVVTNRHEATVQAKRFREYIASPVLTQIKLSAKDVELYDMEPASIPDLLAERPVMILGKYRQQGPAAKIQLVGKSGKGDERWSFSLNEAAGDETLAQLWARKRLEMLYVIPQGDESENQQRITDLGLKYSLLTQYTSFVAVDETIRNPDGSARNVKQPLLLPQGVSDLAVGHDMPEPDLRYLILFMACLVAWQFLRQRRAGNVSE